MNLIFDLCAASQVCRQGSGGFEYGSNRWNTKRISNIIDSIVFHDFGVAFEN